MIMRKFLIDEKGIATLIALMVMVMMTMIGLAVVRLANDEVTIAGNELNEMAAFYAAEAGLERASAAIQSQYEATGLPPSTMPQGSETINNCVAAYTTVDNGAATMRELAQGALAGLHALVKTFTVTSTGTSGVDQSQVVLHQNFEVALVPIFQFAIFYGNDLEIAPGADMTIVGRIHSNGNLWMQAASNLRMDSYVTASGKIKHGRKGPGSVDNGNVLIKDAAGNYQNMLQGGDWLESTDSYWYDSALARWDGRVQDSTFGQGPLNLPLANTGDPHKLIERGSGNSDSYENLASFKIIDGVSYSKIGNVWVDVSALLPAGTITTKSFYDARELTNVNTTEIDMDKLQTSSYFPSNGVIYTSDQRAGNLNSTRLVNGSELDYATTVVSENPLYIKGDFNSVNKKPAFVAGDAVTFLSNSWNDANSTLAKTSRIASSTTANCSFLTGNTNTTSTNYNGGVENLPRFLESWTGRTFTWRGSMINLWNSVQADGNWGSYYDPPIRNWSYDTDLDDPTKLPPETPRLRVFQRIGWQQEYVGYGQ